ncbi:MAG: hypothetical protein ACI4J1_09750 [Ruminiclostridium sp.]
MDKKLKQLFDYQRFENNPRLAAMLSCTREKYDFSDDGELTDDEAEELNAAGSIISDPSSDKRN